MQRLTVIFFITCFSFINLHAQVEGYQLLDSYKEHKGEIETLVISPDGTTMLTADEYGNLLFWDLDSMKVVYKVRAHSACVNSIIFNKRGTKFVSCGDDGKIKLWNFHKRIVINAYQAPYKRVNFAVLSPDESSIYFGGYRLNTGYREDYDQDFTGLYKVKVSDKRSMRELYDDDDVMGYYGTTWGITDGNIDATGKYVVFTKGYRMYLWDIKNAKLSYSLKSPYNLNNVTPRKGAIYAWGDGRIMKWVKGSNGYILTRTVVGGNTSSGYSRMVFSESGKHFITGDDGSMINVWESSSGKRQETLKGHTRPVRAFSYWKNDSVIITGGYDGYVKVYGFPPPPKDTVQEKDTVIVKDTVHVVQVDTVKKDTVPKPIDVIFNEDNIPLTAKNRPVEKQGTFYVNSEEFEIEIWDNSVYDHDVISININGEWILNNYEVTKEKKKVKIHVKPNTNNYLILYAHNLGEISPNTAAVGLRVNGKLQRLTVKSDLKKCGALNFEYKP